MFLPLGSEQSHKKAQLSRFKGGWHFKSSKRRFIVPSKKRLAASGLSDISKCPLTHGAFTLWKVLFTLIHADSHANLLASHVEQTKTMLFWTFKVAIKIKCGLTGCRSGLASVSAQWRVIRLSLGSLYGSVFLFARCLYWQALVLNNVFISGKLTVCYWKLPLK